MWQSNKRAISVFRDSSFYAYKVLSVIGVFCRRRRSLFFDGANKKFPRTCPRESGRGSWIRTNDEGVKVLCLAAWRYPCILQNVEKVLQNA